jgi:transcriptional regulator with XRE-family HTH domain
MADADPNPTVSRLELAARLRELRLQAGKSLEDAAAELMCSVAKISRMETGGRGVQPRDVRDLSRLYGLPDDTREELNVLVRASRASGWWQDFRGLDDQTALFVGLEEAANEERQFDAYRVPGLLQTSDYTRALVSGLRPEGQLSPGQIDDMVAIRLRRQVRLIDSGQLTLHTIVDEAALSRPVGGPEVMQRQVERLIKDSERPNVTLQVIPFDKGPHPGLDGSFQQLSFNRHRLDDTVWIEGLLGSFLLDRSSEVARHRQVFDYLSSQVALTPESSRDWLRVFRPHSWERQS